MKKRELEQRIVELERRLAQLETVNVPSMWINPWPGTLSPQSPWGTGLYPQTTSGSFWLEKAC